MRMGRECVLFDRYLVRRAQSGVSDALVVNESREGGVAAEVRIQVTPLEVRNCNCCWKCVINICDRLVAPRGWLAKIYCNGALASQTFYNLTQHSSHRTHDTHHLLAP